MGRAAAYEVPSAENGIHCPCRRAGMRHEKHGRRAGLCMTALTSVHKDRTVHQWRDTNYQGPQVFPGNMDPAGSVGIGEQRRQLPSRRPLRKVDREFLGRPVRGSQGTPGQSALQGHWPILS
ncbi:hypothetical protein Pure05_04650 [Paenarthrobacter ureafaciens]|nr:hypothetical protein NicSoilE8_25800 [Arthrobacter sp. NicSoilE8]GLU57603.1 hypothetical protein Pure01_01160 [Paenarthrobacter ureafaciens]GLU62217.1 hypothetical protein Pure02_04670 [Paenarthrobacter ureafaciens]GLU66491.1 hypothetical protein Pure03_04670 [Paenarthrobacter ureafaciens]GLU70404.1 hypothetical protein Pure04_01190 [Paenarthrobacter ureafaciens]